MDGLALWISEHVWTFLIAGLLVSVGLAAMAVRAMVRVVRRVRSGAASRWVLGGPLALLAVGGLGLLYFGSGSVIMGPGLVRQHRLVGAPAPELRFNRVSDGAEATLAEHRGKVVLVNLWATWCPPCRHEMPELDRLQRTYRDRGLVVLQLSDEPRQVIADYLAASPMSTEHGFAAELPLPEAGRPTTFVIDREGVVRRVILGPRSFEQFETEIRRHL